MIHRVNPIELQQLEDNINRIKTRIYTRLSLGEYARVMQRIQKGIPFKDAFSQRKSRILKESLQDIEFLTKRKWEIGMLLVHQQRRLKKAKDKGLRLVPKEDTDTPGMKQIRENIRNYNKRVNLNQDTDKWKVIDEEVI